ncbi:MAG: ATP-binding protein [Anaerolineales bacterium]|nr:ATP-binding protein [Anaerolineales bacterium]
MSPLQHAVLTQDSLKAAYETIRRSQPLADHPLYRWVLLQQNLTAPHALRNRQYRQYLLEDLLLDMLTATFDTLRSHITLSAVNIHDPIEAIVADLATISRRGSPLLIGYAYLYYRYVRAELDFSTEDLAKALFQNERTLRRYIDAAWQHLYLTLVRHEHAAREQTQRIRCEQAMPNLPIIPLVEQQQLVDRAVYSFRQSQINSLLISGEKGSGKTSLLYQVGHQLITDQLVGDVTWLDLQPFSSYPQTGKGLAQLILMARYISVQPTQHPVALLSTHLEYLSRHQQRLLLILDNTNGWETALHDLWILLSHITLLATSVHNTLSWFSEFMTAPQLGVESSGALVKHWQRLNANGQQHDCSGAIEALSRLSNGNPGRLYRGYRLLTSLASIPTW